MSWRVVVHQVVCVVAIGLLLSFCKSNRNAEDPKGAYCRSAANIPGCDAPCGEGLEPCASGLYCSDAKTCTADCSQSAGFACPGQQYCAVDGRCLANGQDYVTNIGSGICAEVNLEASGVPPHVYAIVDQSGSMNESLGTVTRWDGLRDLLIGAAATRPGGLVADLQEQVRFGLAMYSSEGGSGPGKACPIINNPNNSTLDNNLLQAPIAPTLRNYETIRALYADAKIMTDTPTGDTLRFLIDRWAANPPTEPGEKVFLLATDGAPDSCAVPNPPNSTVALQVQAEVVAQVQRGFAAGIRTFVVGIANESDLPTQHLQAIANAGVGRMVGQSDAAFYRASTVSELRSAIEGVVRSSRSCSLRLNGEIANMERRCEGEVVLSTDADPQGRRLECDGANGWRVVDANTIELVGQACIDLRQSREARVKGTFPCNVAKLL